jgi:hypothetical protein
VVAGQEAFPLRQPIPDPPRGQLNVRFGSEADICGAATHVRFTPNSDRESGYRQTVMSALPLKADMRSALAHVLFGPKADIGPFIRSIRRPARAGFVARQRLLLSPLAG